jgi:hypothetical protein
MGGVLEGLAFDPPGGERPAAEDERKVFDLAAQRRTACMGATVSGH